MRALIVTSEPFALEDLCDGSPTPAAHCGAGDRGTIEMRLLIPGYPQALDCVEDKREVMRFGDPIGAGETRLLAASIPATHIKALIVDCPDLFGEDAEPLDGKVDHDTTGDHLRFALLSHIAAGIALEAGAHWRPDLVHAIGWPTGLVPLLISACPRPRPATVFTITDGAALGLFRREAFEDLGLPADMLSQLELGDGLSFLRAGVETADVVTDANPFSAREWPHARRSAQNVLGDEAYGAGARGRTGDHRPCARNADVRSFGPIPVA